MNNVRVSAKAIIIKDNQLLVIKHKIDNEIWYSLPGGGQNNGESLTEALSRECMEEIKASIKVGKLIFVRDYIANNHEFAEQYPNFHKVELFFECSLIGEYSTAIGHEPDSSQIGVSWIDIKQLPESQLYPKVFRSLIPRIEENDLTIYLGDVN